MKIPERWTFEDAGVAREFDRHVRESLPWYDLVTGAVAQIARHYIPQRGRVYDLGASTGNIGRAIAGTLVERAAEFIPVESSSKMAAQYRGPGTVLVQDVVEHAWEPFDVAILFLTLMFVPVAERPGLLLRLKEQARRGGAIIIVDRTLPGAGYPAIVLSRLALAGKVATGTPASEIVAKELSLGGVQRPLDPALVDSWGEAVEFFRFGDFAGWIIEGYE